MSITRSKIALALLLLGLASSAHADGLSFGATPNFTGGIDFTFGGGPSGHHGGSPPPSGNDLLLSDGVSYLLLSDGSSKLCLASGC